MRFLKLMIVFMFCFNSLCLAQDFANYSDSGKQFRRGVAAVMFSTIGGAVLGLSTLSFYGRPQEHTENITNGALLGLIAGMSYSLYSAQRNQNQVKPIDSGLESDYYFIKKNQNKRQDVALVNLNFEF